MAEASKDQLKDVQEGNQQAVIGSDGAPNRRAAPGEGVRAPMIKDGADHAEFSIFDGKGNESVVVVAADDEGRTTESAAASSAEALKAAGKPGDLLKGEFGPASH